MGNELGAVYFSRVTAKKMVEQVIYGKSTTEAK